MAINKTDAKSATELYSAILQIRTIEEARMFFRDLLTEEEIVEFGARWRVAQLLDAKVPYSEIEKKTGLSSTTIARISKWLSNGLGGYRLLIDRINSLRQHT
jgi:TrpR-related protein YerC/YecD